MEESYIMLETAQLAKKVGFTEFKQDDVYPEHLYCTHALLAQWLREKKDRFILIWNNACGYSYFINKTGGTSVYEEDYIGPNNGGMWDTYEEALEAGILYSLKHL